MPDNFAIGAHVSIRGGIDQSIDNALRIGAEVFQTHPTPAQRWQPVHWDEEVIARYRSKYQSSGLRGHVMHAIYLVNLATPKDSHREQSIGSLLHYMELARQLDATAVVFHPGSHLGAGFDVMLPQIHNAIREVLARTESPANLLIENSAGSGGCVGCSFEEVGRMLEASDDSRLGVCLDTQHMYASGYDLRTQDVATASLAAFADNIGFERLRAIHANDSRKPLGSNVDRHANIGEGEIGIDGFKLLLSDQRMRSVPWLLEVPGQERAGADLEQINLLRQCAEMAPAESREVAAL